VDTESYFTSTYIRNSTIFFSRIFKIRKTLPNSNRTRALTRVLVIGRSCMPVRTAQSIKVTLALQSISSSDGSDSSDDFFLEICTISILLSERKVKRHRLRVAWEDHATILRHEKQFEAKYRMQYESFMNLAKLLEPNLSQDSSKSLNSCDQPAICHHHILGLTIRWPSGGSCHDI
jgi:hypothetical protein